MEQSFLLSDVSLLSFIMIGVVALLASVFESRAAAAWSARAREALAEANRVGAAKPGPPAAAAGKKKSKKTD